MLHAQLEDLRRQLAGLTVRVQQAVRSAAEAVFEADLGVARQVMSGDRQIDDEEVEVERRAVELLARYQPAAGDLRMITAIIKATNDFERIGDAAVNIAQRVAPLALTAEQFGPFSPSPDLRLLINNVVDMLGETIHAFNLVDNQIAERVLRGDDVNDALYHTVMQDALASLEANGTRANRDLAVIMIAKDFERIGDHCTNIAEDVLYTTLGKIIRHTHTV